MPAPPETVTASPSNSPALSTRLFTRAAVVTVFLLIGGATVNVAVAWGCAAWVHLREVQSPWFVVDDARLQEDADRLWARYAPADWTDTPVRSIGEFQGLGVRGSGAHGRLSPNDERFVLEEANSGLPIRCFIGARIERKSGPAELRWAWKVPYDDGKHHRVIPFGVQPLPFAINTIFYAALLWVLWMARRGPGKIRRLVRVRRGRCPACGYKIAPGVGAACSECGAVLPLPLGEGRGEGARGVG